MEKIVWVWSGVERTVLYLVRSLVSLQEGTMATGWTSQVPDDLPELVVTPATFGRESPMKVAGRSMQ